MEFFKTLLWTVFNWSTSFIYFFIDLIDKIFSLMKVMGFSFFMDYISLH